MIAIHGLSKSYGRGKKRVDVLRGLDFSLPPGVFATVYGRSGAGKSTLLNIIGGLDRAYQGDVSIGGVAYGKLSDAALSRLRGRRIGFVFQNPVFLDHLDVQANLSLAARFAGGDPSKRSAQALLDRFGLNELLHRLPGELSGGQLQRLALARALVGDPLLLLGDEPTGNLDEESANLVIAELIKLKQAGKTLLIVTHDKRLAQKSDDVFVLADGAIRAEREVVC